jgi:hypothetical protein
MITNQPTSNLREKNFCTKPRWVLQGLPAFCRMVAKEPVRIGRMLEMKHLKHNSKKNHQLKLGYSYTLKARTGMGCPEKLKHTISE